MFAVATRKKHTAVNAPQRNRNDSFCTQVLLENHDTICLVIFCTKWFLFFLLQKRQQPEERSAVLVLDTKFTHGSMDLSCTEESGTNREAWKRLKD